MTEPEPGTAQLEGPATLTSEPSTADLQAEAREIAAKIDDLAATQPTWMQLALGIRSTVKTPEGETAAEGADADEDPPEEGGGTKLGPVRDAALFACSYHVRFTDDQKKPRFGLEPSFETSDYVWPPPPDKVPDETARWWPVLADLVQAAAPKARLHAVAFLRGTADRARHARTGAESYLIAAGEAGRQADTVEYLHAALRLARAVGDRDLANRAYTGLLDFVAGELAKPGAGLGFAIQALEITAAEPTANPRIDDLARKISAQAGYVPLADRALKILLRRAAEPDKPAIWRQRVELRRAEALAADHTAVKSLKLQQALQIAEESGQKDLRDQLAADLQATAKEDLGLARFTATSRQYEEEVANQIDDMIGAESWQAALIRFAQRGPVTGATERNRKIIEDRHAAFPLSALFPVHLLGPDNLPSYTGTSPEDRFEVDLVRWEADLLNGWRLLLAEGLHELVVRHSTPTAGDLYTFLQQWPGYTATSSAVLAVALQRFWAGDSDGATHTALSQIEGTLRNLVMSQHKGIYRVQQKHTPGQTLGLGALLPILAETHNISGDWIRCYSAALVHPAGLNLRNILLHGFGGLTGPDTAALVLYLLLHLGMVEPRNGEAAGEHVS